MMLIHALQDNRVNEEQTIWNHYHQLRSKRLSGQEKGELLRFDFGLPRHDPSRIHRVEWSSAVRLAGLEGTAPAALTEKVLSQALAGDAKSVEYLKILENDICWIRRLNQGSKDDWFEAMVLDWLSFIFGIKLRPNTEVREQMRRELIDGFGYQGKRLAARNARIESLAWTPPGNGICFLCRARQGACYKRYYGRPTGVNGQYTFYKMLGSFEAFICWRCRLKCLALTGLMYVVVCLLFGIVSWVLIQAAWGTSGWMGVAAILLALGLPLLSLIVGLMFVGVAQMTQIELGIPRHLAVALNIWNKGEVKTLKVIAEGEEMEYARKYQQ